jgi:PAS domain S-box-containing protein
MTIERRIRITTIVLTVFALGAISILFWSSWQVGRGIKRIETTAQIVRSAFMLRVLAAEFVNQGSVRSLEQWEKENKRLGQMLNDEVIFASTDPAFLRDVRKSYHAVNQLYPRLVEMRVSTGHGAQSQDVNAKKMLTSLMYLQLEQLVNGANDLRTASQSLTLKRRNFVQQLIVGLGISAVFIILINIYLIRKSVIRPLRMLSNGAERVGEGNFDYIAEVKSDDEIGRLTQAFNTMVERLQKRTADLRKARDELELKVAQRTAELELTNESLVREIDERKRAEESVTSERQRLYDILETMPAMVRLLTPDYRVAFANRSFREKFGEDNGRHCFDYCFGLKEPCEFCETYNVLKTGNAHHWERTGPDGSIMDAYVFPFTDTDGSPLVLEMDIDITERKEAEKIREKALETAEILNKIFSTTHFCIVFLDRNFNFISVNQAYADTCGYPPEFFPGKNHFELYPHTENESIFRQVVETGETFTVYAKPFEFPDDPSRGTTYWDWTLHPVKDPRGRVEGLLFVLMEVTERERATKALQVASAYNRRLIEASLDPLVTISAEGKITDVNKATEEVTGYSRDELIGTDFADYFTDTSRAREGYQQVFRDGLVKDYELDIRHREGQLTPVIYNASVYRNESGEITGVFAAARDIGDRKRAEDALRTASAYNRSLLEASLDPLVTISAEGKITDVNKATEKVTGYSRDELIGTDFVDYFTDTSRAREGYQQVFRDGLVKDYELEIRHRAGQLTPVLYNASVYRDEPGKIVGIFAAARDIGERKRVEGDLIRSNKDLEQFAYVASHDLQEPLRNVASCMQMLEKGYKAKLGPDADQLMHYAVDSVARMKALILDLLSYSRISTKGSLPEATDCEKIFGQSLSNLGSAIKETGAVVTHDVLPTVMADPAQLGQVFQNLVGNAVKFRSQERPHVHVAAVKNGSEWIFSVQDNGIGVESRHLERIFVIFQRLNKREDYGGTGMGLAIVKKIVERHRGRIWVESEPGKGTTFYFTIPAKEGTA